MSMDFSPEDKGKLPAQPAKEEQQPQKDRAPLTTGQVQGPLTAGTVQQMQRTLGNRVVQRVLAQRQAGGPAEVGEDIADLINNRRGAGQTLDPDVAGRAGQTMGQDFSDVNVHTDSHADHLSRELNAKAFTTGNDIFFREGAYQPASNDGQRLIAHELTHVVQQGASVPAVQGKMTVNDPNDQYEAEADAVADQIMAQPDVDVSQRQEEEELQMQEEEELQMQEEEEELQMQEDEEELQMKADNR